MNNPEQLLKTAHDLGYTVTLLADHDMLEESCILNSKPEPLCCDCLGGYCQGTCEYALADYYRPEPESELTPLN